MDGELTADQLDEVQSLLEEAAGLYGMIDEVQAKARLIQSSIQEWKLNSWTSGVQDICNSAIQKIRQFHSDLRNYERRLEEISQTLKDCYGPDFVF